MKVVKGVPYFRILNKSKEGIIIEDPTNTMASGTGSSQRMSWPKFNELFEIKDSVWCTARKDGPMWEKTQFVTDMVRNNPALMINLMLVKPSEKLEDMYLVGNTIQTHFDEYVKRWPEETMHEFIVAIRQCITALKFKLNDDAKNIDRIHSSPHP